MKKYIVPLILTACILLTAGCGQTSDKKPQEESPGGYTPDQKTLEALSDGYSLEQAKADGCVTHENGEVTQGREEFEAFYNTVQSGQADTVRLAFYYSIDDPSEYDPDYYESIKDEYPALYIQDLSFDGEKYTVRWFESGEEIVETYSYLMKYEDQAEGSDGSYVEYILTNDDTVTWEELLEGLFSSEPDDYIPHRSVCLYFNE